jgi:hypothetical protein
MGALYNATFQRLWVGVKRLVDRLPNLSAKRRTRDGIFTAPTIILASILMRQHIDQGRESPH